ncbi:MAG TPA: DMT family transporter [Pirellulales bacterium]|nr:DMT family transporter [Pirellulales bacterium]
MFNRAALPYLWMLGGSLAFATMAALARALEGKCDWLVVAACRTGFAMLFAVLLAKAARARLVFWRPRSLWVRSLAGSVSLVCTFYALPRMHVSELMTLTNMFPLWVTLLSWPLYDEVPTPKTWLCLAAGLTGVALVQQPHFANGNFVSLVALASSISTAVAMLGLHEVQGIDPRAIVAHFSTVGLLACSLLFPWLASSEPTAGLDQPAVLFMLLGVGIAATIGQMFLTKAFVAGPPAKVSVVGLAQVAFAVVYDRLLWGRTFAPLTVAGMALVLAPTAWLMLRRETEDVSLASLGEEA